MTATQACFIFCDATTSDVSAKHHLPYTLLPSTYFPNFGGVERLHIVKLLHLDGGNKVM